MQRETCAPPPEHQDKQFHWLRTPMARVRPVEWAQRSFGGMWWIDNELMSGEWLHALGWRYVGPAIPPTEGE